MKITKRIPYSAFALVALAVTMTTVSCQSGKEKKSEQSKDSAFVFTTPKVIDMKGYFEKHYNGDDLATRDTSGVLSLSDIADDVEYVLLKTRNGKQEQFIRAAEHLFLCKDYIFVQEADNIIQYDRQGNLIRTIGRKGGGPGEYNWVYTMVVDDTMKRIFIKTSGKINEYDFEGKFVRDIRSTYDGKLMPLDSNKIATDVQNIWYDVKERLVILNGKGEVEKSFPRYQLFEHTNIGRTDGSDRIPRLTKYHDVVCFNEAYNDTIFELKNNELQMRYFVDWGKYALKPEYIIFENKEYTHNKQACFWLKGFYETDRYIFMPEYRYPKTFVYDKKTDQIAEGCPEFYSVEYNKAYHDLFSSYESGFYNDFDGGLAQNVDEISLDCKYVVGYFPASDVKDYFEEAGYKEDVLHPDKQAKLKALVVTINEEKHNLLIMITKLKE